MTRVFISYRRQDTEGYVGRLYDHLMRFFQPEDIFVDIANISPGEDFVSRLDEAISECDVVLPIIGAQWLTISDDRGRRIDHKDDFVRLEIESALKLNKHIIPVLVGRASMPSAGELPTSLRSLGRRHAIELSHQGFAADVERLVDAIRSAGVMGLSTLHAPGDPESLRRKEAALKAVRLDVLNASTSPLYAHRVANHYYPVVGDGSADARLMFIGQSPGKDEAETGKSFCGASGDVFNAMLASIHLNRDDVFVTNLLHDRPPENRQPSAEEIAFYSPYLDQIIDIVRPAVIITLGRFATSNICRKYAIDDQGGRIGVLHGKLMLAQTHYGDIQVVPMYHPAAVLYKSDLKETLLRDFEKLKLFI